MPIEKHQKDYRYKAYMEYTKEELVMWVHLLTKRATHRTSIKKIQKDLYDAKNYISMLELKLLDKP